MYCSTVQWRLQITGIQTLCFPLEKESLHASSNLCMHDTVTMDARLGHPGNWSVFYSTLPYLPSWAQFQRGMPDICTFPLKATEVYFPSLLDACITAWLLFLLKLSIVYLKNYLIQFLPLNHCILRTIRSVYSLIVYCSSICGAIH